MIISNLSQVKLNKEKELGHKITYEMIMVGAGVSQNVIARLRKFSPLSRIDGKSLDGLCRYFGCQVGDLLEFVPDTVESND
jgi:DNA-binding Xre family transcriptional regulator